VVAPKPPWHREPRRRATKPQLSQGLIVETALKILAAEGLEAVNMRRVAQELETGAASLYAHVANKNELGELMYDRVLGEAPVPEADPERWAEQLAELLRGEVRAMVAYPGIARVAWQTMIPVGPNALHHAEGLLAILRAGGLSLRQAAFAGDALALYTKANAYEASMWTFGEVDETEVAQRSQQMKAYMSSLPETSFPNMLQLLDFFNAENAQERFDLALEMFIAGLTHLAAKNAATKDP
jgi:AcrR family transcriptional regulator